VKRKKNKTEQPQWLNECCGIIPSSLKNIPSSLKKTCSYILWSHNQDSSTFKTPAGFEALPIENYIPVTHEFLPPKSKYQKRTSKYHYIKG